MIDRVLAALRGRLVPDAGPGTWRTLWADEDAVRVPQAVEDLVSPLLFGGPSVLVVRRAEALGGTAEEAVLTALPRLGDAGRLVLVARSADQRRRLVATCLRGGGSIACPAVTDLRIARAWVGHMARERACTLDREACEALVDRVGTDLGCLAGEVEKLAIAETAGARVDATFVRRVVTPTRGHAVHELSDAIAGGDYGAAVRALGGLLADGEPPVRVVAFLAANLRRALAVGELTAQGMRDDDIAARVGMPAWLVAKQRTGRSCGDLVRALAVLARLDRELKRSRPPVATITAAIAEMIA